MAVAAHVSRVAKDYAPHGYSIQSNSVSGIDLPTGTTNTYYTPLYFATDCDVYVEEAAFYPIVALGSHSANYWSFTLVSAPPGLASEAQISTTVVGGASTALPANVPAGFTITSPVVAKGQLILLKAVANHASAALVSASGIMRLRRKA
jgi:hypothetical protein